MSNSVRPHRRQPTRLPRPWDSPGKNTGVGCHFLLQCMQVKSDSEVTQSCPTPSDPMDCSLPGSSVHGICQARVLEWVATAFSAGCPRACYFTLGRKKKKREREVGGGRERSCRFSKLTAFPLVGDRGHEKTLILFGIINTVLHN